MSSFKKSAAREKAALENSGTLNINNEARCSSSVRDEMKVCLNDVHVEGFSTKWEKNILNLLPRQDKQKYSTLIKSMLNEVRDTYIKDMQQFAVKVVLSSPPGDDDVLTDYTECRHLKNTGAGYKIFLKRRYLLEKKYFLSIKPIKMITIAAAVKLPNIICDFKRYHQLGTITIAEFQNVITSDIKKGSLTVTNQFYVAASKAVANSKVLQTFTPKQLSRVMQCITNIFVQQILNVMIKSIDHIINVMEDGIYCPQIKLKLVLRDTQLRIDPSVEEIFSNYHNIIKTIDNIAQDLIPFEEWLHRKTTQKYIKIKLPDSYVKESHEKLQTALENLFKPIKRQLSEIGEEFSSVYATTARRKIRTLTARKTDFNLYLKHVQTYNAYAMKTNLIVANLHYPMGRLEQNEAKESLKKESLDVVNTFLAELIKYHKEYNASICSEFEQLKTKALNVPKDAKSLIELSEYVSYASETLVKELKRRIQGSISMLSALLSVTTLTDDHIELNGETINWLYKIEPVFSQHNTLCEAMKSELEDDMQRIINLLNSKVDDIVPQLTVLDDMDDVNRVGEYVEHYKGLLKQMNEIDFEMRMINEEERLFKFPETEFPKVIELKEIIMPFHVLIYVIYQWQRDNSVWLDGPFEWLDAVVVEKKTLNYLNEISEMSKKFKSQIKMDITANKCFKFSGIADDPDPMQLPAPLKLCWQALNDINEFKKYLPLVICMCNPALRKRHWLEMCAICNFDLTPNAGTSLRKIIGFNLMNNIEKYEAISIGANRELALQEELSEMIGEWDNISFEMNFDAVSGKIVFVNLNDIELLLGEQFRKIEEMKASNFVKPIIASVTPFFSSLTRIQEIINTWDHIETRKLSLDAIFSYPKAKTYLPRETAEFAKVKNDLSNCQSKVSTVPSFQELNDPSVLGSLRAATEQIEKIEKAVKDYIESKKLCFPRFFFLSDSEIQKVLFESDNVDAMYAPLKKCFKGVQKLRITTDKKIRSIVGDYGEELHLRKFISTDDNSKPEEKWLTDLEYEISNATQKSIVEYCHLFDDNSICSNAADFPSMAVVCAFQIHWTSEVRRCFTNSSSISFKSLQEKYTGHLTRLIDEVKNCSSLRYRDTLMSLIVVVANQKEVIQLLLDRKITVATSFEWAAQLQYYLDAGYVQVSILNTTIQYGYEYNYYKQSIVNTALTDRCFHTIIQAYKYHLYGAVVGPSATGKTETVRSLSKALATQFHIFNCTPTFSYSFLSQIFKGLISCGAWICFENFHRLKIEVLSAIAQKMGHISRAVATKLPSVTFEGTQLKLKPTGHISVIMNLVQSGYPDLPDNLKILFRTVSMMTPDVQKITEVELFAAGFSNAKLLAVKLVVLYRTLSDQMWCKSCNNFGIHSVKTVVKTAICLKKSFPDESEVMLCLRAVIDINLPKLCNRDVLTFKSTVHAMFPNVHLLPPNYTIFLNALETVCETRSIEIHDIFKLKIIQTFELMYVHRGLILVGDPLGGKTEILHTLTDTLLALSKQGMEHGLSVKLETVIPGVASNDQLFGRFDDKSKIWTDGLCCKIFRSFSECNLYDRKWIVFDGPLGDTWTENLYTALDASKVLFLTSGERINVTDSTSIIFETMNMVEASPALLSRCGIVYIDAESIDWRTHVKSHICKHSIYSGYEEILNVLFDWAVEPCLQFLQKNCTTTFVRGKLHFVVSLLNLFGMYLKDACAEINEEKGKISHFVIWAQAALILSIVWALGGNLDVDSHVKFNNFLLSLWRGANEEHPKPEKIKNFEITLPNDGLIQDNYYIFKGVGNWKYWGDALKSEKIFEARDSNHIFVPTVNTVKYSDLLLKHVKYGVPFLFCGDISIGKTSLMRNLLKNKLPEERYITNFFSFTSLDTVERTQRLLLSKLNKIKTRYYGQPRGQYTINFLDDLNAETCQNKSETAGVLELLRQYHEHAYFYDVNEPERIFIQNILFILAVTGKVRNSVCPRFLRHFNAYTMHTPAVDNIFKIFSNVLYTNLKRNLFAADVLSSVTSVVNATIGVYDTLIKKLRPTPTKFQYCFNLRDISRIIDGCSLLQKESVETKVTFIRIWVHETWRVFGDRMLDDGDREWLFSTIRDKVKGNFKDSFETAFDYLPKFGSNQITKESFNDLMFANFMDSEKSGKSKKYEEINSMESLKVKVISYINEYNGKFKKHIDVVASRYILECLIKISRVLSTPAGNLLIVSNVGFGRKSVTKLAAYLQQQKLFEPSVDSYRDLNLWREDLKTVLQECGALRKDLTLFLTDEQIKDSFLRDVGSLLATGEIPDLFSVDDRRSIIETVRLDAQGGNRNAEISISSVMNYFIEQCRNKLHIVLCFAPTNRIIRSCLREHSGFAKYCTINWYETWPTDALLQISARYIQEVNIQEHVKPNTINACVKVYDKAREMSSAYHQETGRVIHITSSAFLHMLKLYIRFMSKKQEEIVRTRNRYLAGLEKLEFAAQQVEQMKTTLTILKPQLELSAQQTVNTMKEVENENVTVERATILVKQEEEIANKKAAIAGTLKVECEADLAVAIPILEDAVAALNTLKPTDITLVKAMKNPPDTVKLVMAAVCVMLNVPPDRTIDPVTGKKHTDYWGPSKRVLGDMNFLQNLKEYDKDSIPTSVMQIIKKTYMTDNSFRPHIVAKASSAAEGLCKWVRAMVSYDDVAKVVAPKKEKLLGAQRECDEAEAFLNEKRRTLSALNAKLAALNNSLQETLEQKLKLEKEVENCTNKLKKAEKLIASLGGEKSRWVKCAEDLQANYDNLVGDMILSSSAIAYMASYDIAFRDKILENWIEYITELKIPYTKNYNFVNVLGVENEINHWYFCGLPKNRFSTENAIIMKNSELSCLFVDSQNQANQWIKKIEKKNDLKVVQLTDSDYMAVIRCNVENGKPVLIENVGEHLDILLNPFLYKNIFKDNECWYLDTGRDVVKYSHNFRLYITTRLLNPRYSYEISNKLTIIDFSIPNEALEERLLAIVISKEKPELQEKFEALLVEDATNKRILKQQEDNILSILSSTTTNILEDENAIQTLDYSKNLSLNVSKKQEAVKQTAIEINKFRDNYIQFAKHCAGLFSTLNALAYLNHMYRFSFSWFIQLYITSIETSNRSIILEKRLRFLKFSFTQNLYLSVCRSLSEKHKILYSFLLCSKILLDAQQATEEEIKYFMSSNSNDTDIVVNSGPTWLMPNTWGKICDISRQLPAFNNLANDFYDNNESWKIYYNSEPLQNQLIPKPWIETLSSFQKLILVKILRPDKVIIQITQLIMNTMGNTEDCSPQLKISRSYAESSCLNPLIFILPSCSSPLSLISAYASTKGYSSKFIALSMGENQESKAEFLIREAQKDGGWIFLENCHLATDWMVQLEKICENCNASNLSLEFRLWLSSYPIDEFPISILQNSIKITHDSPLDLKQNLLNIYQSEPIVNQEFFEGCSGKDVEFSKLLFGLCFFHIVSKERRYFGIQGWNIPYDFDHSDLQISITQLQDFINNTDYIPFDIILYLIGECNYGGKIVDNFDQRCLKELLNYYCNIDIIKHRRYTCSNEIEQLVPQRCEYPYVINHISNMPLHLSSLVFGSNRNGVITRDTIIAAEFISSMSFMNPIVTTPYESSMHDEVVILINDINNRLPKSFEIDEVQTKYTSGSPEPLERVLLCEAKSLNQTLQTINCALTDLQLALNGGTTFSDALEELTAEIYNNKIPRAWKELNNNVVLENLSYYINNLLKRVNFIQSWADNAHPIDIRLDVFFSCNMFFSAIRLTFSNQHNIPIEEVTFDFKVTTTKDSPDVDDINTYFIQGLYLSGAHWNYEKNMLEESFTNIFSQNMPPIRFNCTQKKMKMDAAYVCPAYIAAIPRTLKSFTSNRRNYIVSIPLKTSVDQTHWIKCGTALFCQIP